MWLSSLLIFKGLMDGPKDPWPRVLSLPERFVGDPAPLARDSILKSRFSGRFTICNFPEFNYDSSYEYDCIQVPRNLPVRLVFYLSTGDTTSS